MKGFQSNCHDVLIRPQSYHSLQNTSVISQAGMARSTCSWISQHSEGKALIEVTKLHTHVQHRAGCAIGKNVSEDRPRVLPHSRRSTVGFTNMVTLGKDHLAQPMDLFRAMHRALREALGSSHPRTYPARSAVESEDLLRVLVEIRCCHGAREPFFNRVAKRLRDCL